MDQKLSWHTDYDEADPQVIKIVEERANISLPLDYLKIAIKFHGGEASLRRIKITNNKATTFNCLLTFLAFDELDILDRYNIVRGKLGEKIFPFAIDIHGNYFCFDYRLNKDKPGIVFWDKELGNESTEIPLISICETFSEFLDRLY